MSAIEKPKKKYKKMQKKEEKINETINLEQNTCELTKTQLNDSKDLSLSAIMPHNTSILTENTSVFHQQSTFLGSFVDLKQELLQNNFSEHYQNCKDVIQDKDLLKVLKKYTKTIFKNIKDIQILQSLQKPALIFSFTDVNTNKTVRHSLRDFLKANKEMGQRQSKTISQIFDKMYHRIGEQFYKIMQIVLKIADKERVQLKINTAKLSKNPLLYYCINDKNINFALFDQEMRMFQFDSLMLSKIKLQSKQQRLWKKFSSHIENKKRQNEKIIQQFGQYQASSDQQSKKSIVYREKVDVLAIKQKLKQFFTQSLIDYEEQIEERESLYNQIRNKDDDKQRQKLQILAQEISQLHHNLQNFKKTLEQVSKQQKSLKLNDGQKYKNLLKRMILAKKQLESKLPIIARKRDIFNALDKDDLIILQGETGSGKSTQLPQIMCEYFKVFDPRGKQILPILITQPRKLATRTVAERVANQMDQDIGGFVDYATSAHKLISKTAKIIFKMDTLALDQLTVDRNLSKYSCLIIDQAHQRTISIDVILGLIKQLQTKRKGFKVIVTSASLDAKLFSEYFKKKVMKVSGRLYPVDIMYRSFNHQSDMIRKIENVIKKDILLTQSQIRPQYKGDILVFCSGVEQINILCNIFHKYLNLRVFQVYPLHGRIAPSQQRQIFMKTKEYKLIFASRIAETSITINGVKVVVDPGYDRQQVYDQKNRVSSRKLINISQSSAKQRAGRAGRTSKGFCFRLYSQAQLKTFRPNKTPQIQNMALDTLVLRLKMLNIKQIFKFPYINKPQDKALQKSVQTLLMIGALDFRGDVTIVGKLLLQLRIEPFLGRAIVEAIICEEIIKKTDFAEKNLRKQWDAKQIKRLQNIRTFVVQILSMVINSSNVFYNFTQFNKNRDKIEEIKFKKFSDQRGDFFYLQNIYDEFVYRIKQPPAQLNNWIHSRFLNKKTLYQTKELVQQINETIKNFKIDLKDPPTKKLVDIIKIRMTECKNADDTILSCMMTSFCVNLCLYSNNPNIGYTLILQKKPILIYGTSTLALLSRFPKWIICYQLKTNEKGTTYCQIAHEVDYKFLKNTVDDLVFDKLNLKQAQYMNPYYQTIERSLPTMILQEISNEYINRQNLKSPVFKYLSIITKEQTNTLSVSYSKDLKIDQIFGCKLQTTIREYIQSYIQQKILQKKLNKLNFHLMSNIYVEIKDGLVLQKIYFTSKQVEFIVNGKENQLIIMKGIMENQGINCRSLNKEKIKIFTIVQDQYTFTKTNLQNHGLMYEQFVKQQKQSSLNAKIYMKFYTGKREDKPIFLLYGKRGQQADEMCEILQNCRKTQNIKSTQQKYKYFNILCASRFKVSKNRTGIRCFNDKTDAFQLKQAIQYLAINAILPYNFKLPINIREFRETDNIQAIKQQKQWQSEIQKIFQKQGFKDIAIKVKGDDREVNQQHRGNNMQKLIKHELTAQLTADKIQTLDELVKKFDGKQKIIGLGKIHFRYNFRQHIVKINKRVFKSLKSKFDYLQNFYEVQYAQLRIETKERIFGKIQHIFISCRCPNRQRLLQPSERIKDLFTPFLIRLEPTQFNFLYNSQQGEDFMNKLQQDHNYSIAFGFDKRKNIVKLYCEDQDQYNNIEERVFGIFQKYKFVVDNISYRGKGLNRVVEVIDKQKKSIQQRNKIKKTNIFIEYSIIFRTREVQIEGDPQSIKKVKQNIANLIDQKSGSCQICLKNTEKPYKLFNCLHSFCWKCLGNYIEQSRKRQNNNQELVCPEDNCNKLINPHDIKVILSTEEFQSFSLRRVKYFVKENNKKFFFCPTNGCEQIFQSDTVGKNVSFECYICGKWFCSKCRQPHQHFTCSQWQQKLAKGQLSRFGYKKCRCGSILQKQLRQKIIKCKSCQEYLCWSCVKGWKAQKDCKNHVRACKR